MAQQRIGGFLAITLLLAALLIIAVFAVGGRDRDRSEIIEPPGPNVTPVTRPAFLKPLPRTQSAEEKRQVNRRAQQLLADLGYDPGPVDGTPGNKTRSAIQSFQKDHGLAQDGAIDSHLVSALESPPPRSHGPGLGMTRASLQRFFESPKLGFKFKNTSLRDGRPRVVGKSKNGIAELELLGPSGNLTAAAIMIGTPNDTPESVVEKAAYMVGFVKTALPEWPGATEWVSNNLERAAVSGDIKTTRGAKEISITVDQERSRFAITVKGAR